MITTYIKEETLGQRIRAAFFYGRTYEIDHADTDESSGKCKKVMLNPMGVN